MQFIYESENIRHMFDDVTTEDLFKLIVAERIWKLAEIMNDIGVTQRIRVDTNRAGKFVLTATDIENSSFRCCRWSTVEHALVFVQEQRCKFLQVDGVNRLAQSARDISDPHSIQHYRFITLEH